MRKIKGGVFLSLDGVMQAPGGPTEDWTGGFDLGGWVWPHFDEAGGQAIDSLFGGTYDLLLGRKTYDIFAAYWPYVTGEAAEMGEAFTCAGKYVLTKGQEPLDWENSHRLRDIGAVETLKQSDGPDLIIQGSSTIYPALLRAGLLDRLQLMIFPVVLGGGKKLFGEGTPPAAMKLVDHKVTPSGVVIATYEPAGGVQISNPLQQEPSAREQARQERMKREG
jgi:dihydrofolate reductase